MQGDSKVLSLSEAVRAYVRDGMTIAMGCALEGFIPFAAGHEILRQNRKNLTLVGPISDMLFDQMIGGGAVRRVIAAWVGNVSSGVGYHFRRAMEKSVPVPLDMLDHSNFSLALALNAGAMGIPFGVTRSLLGSDIGRNPDCFKEFPCPFTGQKLLAVKALNPDLTIVHAQKADAQGNVQCWGNFGVTMEAAMAAEKVMAVVEEVVPSDAIRADPNRTIIPGFKVCAVVHEPWGAHPSAVQGYYGHHDSFYLDYADNTRSEGDSAQWFRRFVYGVGSRREYLTLFDPAELKALEVRVSAPGPSVEFGY